MDIWLETYEKKGQELVKYLSTGQDVKSSNKARDALEVTKKILYSAVLVLTNKKFRVSEVNLEETSRPENYRSAEEHKVTLEHLLKSDGNTFFSNEDRILQKAIIPLIAIKKEIISLEPNLDDDGNFLDRDLSLMDNYGKSTVLKTECVDLGLDFHGANLSNISMVDELPGTFSCVEDYSDDDNDDDRPWSANLSSPSKKNSSRKRCSSRKATRKKIPEYDKRNTNDILSGQRRLLMMRYECFLCEDGPEFGSDVELADHIQAWHITAAKSGPVLNCIYCAKVFNLTQQTSGYIHELLVFYVGHLVQKHRQHFPLPDYIQSLSCPSEGCSVVTYSIYAMRKHLQHTHNVILTNQQVVETFSDNVIGVTKPITIGNRKSKRKKDVDDAWEPPVKIRKKSPVKVRKKPNARKRRVVTNEDISEHCRIHKPFSMTDEGDSVSRVSEYAAYSERQICLSSPQCFICSNQHFESDYALKEHWKSHWEFSSTHAIFRCQRAECETKYKMLKKKFLACNISEIMAMYCQHLIRIHEMGDAIPDYIIRHSCPVVGCQERFFTLLFLRNHLRKHGIEVNIHNLRDSKYLVGSADNQAEFLQYYCFLCNDQSDHASVMDFVNHWLMEHIFKESQKFQLKCPRCDTQRHIPAREGVVFFPEVMWLIGWCLNHLATEHEFKVPSYVSHVPNDLQLSTSVEFSPEDTYFNDTPTSTNKRKPTENLQATSSQSNRRKVITSPPSSATRTDRKISLKSKQCLLCLDSVVYESDTILCNHFVKQHTKRSLSFYSMPCPKCVHTWKIRRSRCVADIMEWMTFIISHLQKQHSDEYTVPDFVNSLPCPLSKCGFVAFSRNSLRIHMNSHGLKSWTDDSSIGSWSLTELPTHAIYSKYICFVCKDQQDYVTLLEYVNHWLDSHIQEFNMNSTKRTQCFVMECPYCRRAFGISKRQISRVSSVLNTISTYLLHLVTEHNVPQPDYVIRLPEETEANDSADEERGHSAISAKYRAKTVDIVMFKGMQERRISLTSYRCFSCEQNGLPPKEYESEKELSQHWLDYHFVVTDKVGILQCKLCGHTYRIKRHKLISCNILETMAFFVLHCRRVHNFEVPDYIMWAACPVYGCSFYGLMLSNLKQHMKKHGFPYATCDQLRQADLPMEVQKEWVDFKQFKCFVCKEEDKEFATGLAFMNHWLESHVENLDASDAKSAYIQCSEEGCDFQVMLPGKLILPKVWERMSILLFHLIESHEYIPGEYIVTRACSVNDCNQTFYSEGNLERHLEKSHNMKNVETFEIDGEYQGKNCLQYKHLRCFECQDSVLCESMQDLALHWEQQHMAKTENEVKLQCSECEKAFVEKYVYVGPALNSRLTHEMVSRYFMHKIKKHTWTVPSFILALSCIETACSFFTYTTKALENHFDKEHKKPLRYSEASTSKRQDMKSKSSEQAVEEEDEGNIYERRPLDISMSRFCCFLCANDHDFGDRLTYTSHYLRDHCSPQENGYILQCPHCWKKYSMTNKARNPKLIMEVIGSLLMHLFEKHNISAPDYIEKVPCLKPGCTYFTYTTDRLASHLKVYHNIIDTKLGRFKSKGFKNEKKSGKNLTSKLIIKMRDYKCFVCALHAVPEVEFDTHLEFAEHWRECHYALCEDMYTMKCAYCDHGYKVPRIKGQEASGIMENVSFYFMHLVNKHKLNPPEYVIPYRCEALDCDYVTFTLFSLENHCKSRHKMTHEALVKLIERDAAIHQAINQGSSGVNTDQVEKAVIMDSVSQSDTDLARFGFSATFHQPTEPMLQPSTDILYSNFMPYQLTLPQPSASQSAPQPSFMCFKCGNYYNTAEERKAHMDEAHNADPLNLCYICSRGFRTTDSFYEHMFKDHGIVRDGLQGLYCDQCDFSTVFSSKLARHIHKVHKSAERVHAHKKIHR